MQIKKEKRKNAEVVLTGALPKETIERATEKTLLRIQKELALPGFRKGTAPLGNVRAHVGERALWKEAAEAALRNALEEILKEQEVLPVLPVSASLSSGEPGLEVPFEIIVTVAPTCSIENYRETAQRALESLSPLDVEGGKTQALDALRAQSRQMVKSEGAGPLTDDEAKKLGFENSPAAEFFIAEEAERAVKERELQRKRAAIAEALIAQAACDIPRTLVRQESSALLESMKRDIARQGVPFNEYLKHRNKTEEEVQSELEAPAEKRVCLELLFAEIAKAENMTPDEKEEERLAHALVQQGVDHETARRYVRATTLREGVWECLGTPAVSKMPEPAPN